MHDGDRGGSFLHKLSLEYPVPVQYDQYSDIW
jgi:hypothetical protein